MLEKSICKSKHHTSTKPDGYWIVCFRLLKVGELQIECSWNPLESHKHIPLVRAVLLKETAEKVPTKKLVWGIGFE